MNQLLFSQLSSQEFQNQKHSIPRLQSEEHFEQSYKSNYDDSNILPSGCLRASPSSPTGNSKKPSGRLRASPFSPTGFSKTPSGCLRAFTSEPPELQEAPNLDDEQLQHTSAQSATFGSLSPRAPNDTECSSLSADANCNHHDSQSDTTCKPTVSRTKHIEELMRWQH